MTGAGGRLPENLRAGLSTLYLLTAQETAILRMLAAGMDNRAVARQLGIREATVKAHMTAVLGKLGVSSRLQAGLVAFAACLDGRLDWNDLADQGRDRDGAHISVRAGAR